MSCSPALATLLEGFKKNSHVTIVSEIQDLVPYLMDRDDTTGGGPVIRIINVGRSAEVRGDVLVQVRSIRGVWHLHSEKSTAHQSETLSMRPIEPELVVDATEDAVAENAVAEGARAPVPTRLTPEENHRKTEILLDFLKQSYLKARAERPHLSTIYHLASECRCIAYVGARELQELWALLGIVSRRLETPADNLMVNLVDFCGMDGLESTYQVKELSMAGIQTFQTFTDTFNPDGYMDMLCIRHQDDWDLKLVVDQALSKVLRWLVLIETDPELLEHIQTAYGDHFKVVFNYSDEPDEPSRPDRLVVLGRIMATRSIL